MFFFYFCESIFYDNHNSEHRKICSYVVCNLIIYTYTTHTYDFLSILFEFLEANLKKILQLC